MHVPEAVAQLARDLQSVFGQRLRSLMMYGADGASTSPPVPTIAVVDRLTADDLEICASRIAGWHAENLRTPLFVPESELSRSLDAFPLEFSGILTSYQVIAGADPFAGVGVQPLHLRMACEVQARSHLLHLREDYLETEGRGSALAELIADSAPALAALVIGVARLEGANAPTPEAAARHVEGLLGVSDGTLTHVTGLAAAQSLPSDEARRRWPGYLEAIERLTRHVDGWGSA